MKNHMQSDQMVHDNELLAMGIPSGTELLDLFEAINQNTDRPLRIYGVGDEKLYIKGSKVLSSNGTDRVLSVSQGSIPAVADSWIDFQNRTTNGAPFNLSWPASTVGKFRRCVISLKKDGSISANFTDEVATDLLLPDPMTALDPEGEPVGYLDLECTDVLGKFKTVGTVGDPAIENFTMGAARIHQLMMINSRNVVKSFKIFELPANGSNYIEIAVPDSLSVTTTYVLPNADGNPQQVLKTDGAGNLLWGDVTATPAGNDTEVQFNDGSNLGSDPAFTFNKVTKTLTVKGPGIFGDLAFFSNLEVSLNTASDYDQVIKFNRSGSGDAVLEAAVDGSGLWIQRWGNNNFLEATQLGELTLGAPTGDLSHLLRSASFFAIQKDSSTTYTTLEWTNTGVVGSVNPFWALSPSQTMMELKTTTDGTNFLTVSGYDKDGSWNVGQVAALGGRNNKHKFYGTTKCVSNAALSVDGSGSGATCDANLHHIFSVVNASFVSVTNLDVGQTVTISCPTLIGIANISVFGASVYYRCNPEPPNGATKNIYTLLRISNVEVVIAKIPA